MWKMLFPLMKPQSIMNWLYTVVPLSFVGQSVFNFLFRFLFCNFATDYYWILFDLLSAAAGNCDQWNKFDNCTSVLPVQHTEQLPDEHCGAFSCWRYRCISQELVENKRTVNAEVSLGELQLSSDISHCCVCIMTECQCSICILLWSQKNIDLCEFNKLMTSLQNSSSTELLKKKKKNSESPTFTYEKCFKKKRLSHSCSHTLTMTSCDCIQHNYSLQEDNITARSLEVLSFLAENETNNQLVCLLGGRLCPLLYGCCTGIRDWLWRRVKLVH